MGIRFSLIRYLILSEYVAVANLPEESPGISGLAAILGLLGIAYLKRKD